MASAMSMCNGNFRSRRRLAIDKINSANFEYNLFGDDDDEVLRLRNYQLNCLN